MAVCDILGFLDANHWTVWFSEVSRHPEGFGSIIALDQTKETPVNSSQNHRGWKFVLLFSFSPKERASGRSHTEHWLFLSVAVHVFWNCNELLLFPATLPQWKCASSHQQHKLSRIENDRQWNQPKCCNTGHVPQSSLSTLRENMQAGPLHPAGGEDYTRGGEDQVWFQGNNIS